MSTIDFNTGEFNWKLYSSIIKANIGQPLELQTEGGGQINFRIDGNKELQIHPGGNITTNSALTYTAQSGQLTATTFIGSSLGTSSVQDLELKTNGTTRLAIKSNGNIDVSGNTNFTENLPTCSIVPSSNSQLVNKSYVDAAFGYFQLSSFSGGLCNWTSAAQRGSGVAVSSSVLTPSWYGYIRFTITLSASCSGISSASYAQIGLQFWNGSSWNSYDTGHYWDLNGSICGRMTQWLVYTTAVSYPFNQWRISIGTASVSTFTPQNNTYIMVERLTG